MNPWGRKYKETHQCGSFSEGIPRDSDAIIPRQVPIWHKDPREPLYFVGATYTIYDSE